jgi:hypothetical protein
LLSGELKTAVPLLLGIDPVLVVMAKSLHFSKLAHIPQNWSIVKLAQVHISAA